MVPGNHPEMDNSEVLNGSDDQKYQMLLDMKGQNIRAIYTFSYLEKKPNRRIRIDHRDPAVVKNGAEGQVEVDLSSKMREHFPEAEESINDQLPKPFFDELTITVYIDSDHAYDKLTRRSITGLIIFVGRTPVLYQSKRQGAVETSTYGVEFLAMKTTVEKVMAV
eukprot:1699701-Ditylum_brightwellii.AAC.1